MTLRAVFVADGSSDLPIAQHLGQMCRARGIDIQITTPDPARLMAASRSVEDRLTALRRIGDPIDIYFIHRDAEASSSIERRREILEGAENAGVTCPVVPIVPVRMTEAWLVLNEPAIGSGVSRGVEVRSPCLLSIAPRTSLTRNRY